MSKNNKMTIDFFYNKIYSREMIESLIQKSGSSADFRDLIMTHIITNKNQIKNEFRDEIYLDFICNLYKFSSMNRFCVEKMSTLFSLMDYLFNKSLDDKLTALESYDLYNSIMKNHIHQCEPYSIGIFSENDSKIINKYLRDNYYKFYSLYENTLTKFIDYNIFTETPLQEKWVNQYESLDNGEIIEPALVILLKINKIIILKVPELEEYFYLPSNSKLQTENENEIKVEENNENEINNEKKENIEQIKLNIPKTKEEQIVEKEINDRIENYKADLSKKLAKFTEIIINQSEEILKRKK